MTLAELVVWSVPSAADFEEAATHYLEDDALSRFGSEMIASYPDLAEADGFRIVFRWRDEGPEKDGHVTAGQCQKLSDLLCHATGVHFVIWLAADLARTWRPEQIAAALYHELRHVAVDPTGTPKMRRHDAECFVGEVRQFGPWRQELRDLADTFEQLRLPLPA